MAETIFNAVIAETNSRTGSKQFEPSNGDSLLAWLLANIPSRGTLPFTFMKIGNASMSDLPPFADSTTEFEGTVFGYADRLIVELNRFSTASYEKWVRTIYQNNWHGRWERNLLNGEYTFTSQSAMETALVNLADTLGARASTAIWLYPNFTSIVFSGAPGYATIVTGTSASYFSVSFHNYVTVVHGTYMNGTWSWQKIDSAKNFYTSGMKNLSSNTSTTFTITSGLSYVVIIGDGNGESVFAILVFHNGVLAKVTNLGSFAISATVTNGTTLTITARAWCFIQAWSDKPIT